MQKRLLTLPEFLAAHPQFTASQLRYALRNRATNGLKGAIFKRRTGHAFLFDERATLAWLSDRTPA